MNQEQNNWIIEYETPNPLLEQQVGDAKGLYVNSAIAYSYLRDVDRLYPVHLTLNGKLAILFHTICPSDYDSRSYKIYKQKRGNRTCYFIPLPKPFRSGILQGKRKGMFLLKVMLSDLGEKLILIDLYSQNLINKSV